MFHFGFSYIGLIWLLMLFVPNIIWTKNKPSGYEESEKKENKLLLIFERFGQALVTVSVLIFSDFNIDLNSRRISFCISLMRAARNATRICSLSTDMYVA